MFVFKAGLVIIFFFLTLSCGFLDGVYISWSFICETGWGLWNCFFQRELHFHLIKRPLSSKFLAWRIFFGSLRERESRQKIHMKAILWHTFSSLLLPRIQSGSFPSNLLSQIFGFICSSPLHGIGNPLQTQLFLRAFSLETQNARSFELCFNSIM